MRTRILMSEADGGDPKSGTPLAGTPPPSEPQAKGGAVVVDEATRKAIIDEARNSIYAEMRRNGVLKKSAVAAMEQTNGKPPEPQGQAAAPDPSILRSLDRSLARLGLADSLSETQYKRAEKAFLDERPEDSEAWAKDYFNGFGAAKQQQPPPQQGQAPPKNAHPASDAGSPARSETPLETQDVLTMSHTDVARLIERVGIHKYTQMLQAATKGKRVNIRE